MANDSRPLSSWKGRGALKRVCARGFYIVTLLVYFAHVSNTAKITSMIGHRLSCFFFFLYIAHDAGLMTDCQLTVCEGWHKKLISLTKRGLFTHKYTWYTLLTTQPVILRQNPNTSKYLHNVHDRLPSGSWQCTLDLAGVGTTREEGGEDLVAAMMLTLEQGV